MSFFQEWQPFFEAVNVFASSTLAVCVLLLAREQNRLARTQAKIDAQERRLAIYDSITEFLASIAVHGTTGPKELHSMLRQTRHAQFFFPQRTKIRELIDELYNKGVDLEYCEEEIASLRNPQTVEALKGRIEDSRKLRDWFRAKRKEIDEQFRPYLAFDESESS